MNVMKKLFLLAIMIVFTFFSCQSGQNLKNVEKTQNPVPMDLKNFDTIQLIAPDTMGGKSLMQAFQHRKSDREFKQTPLSLKHLSEILWEPMASIAGWKKNRSFGYGSLSTSSLAVLSNGIYRYDLNHIGLCPL
jgi:hypothetical protein